MKTNKDIVKECLIRINEIQEYAEQYQGILYFIRLDNREDLDSGNVYNKLVERELGEWRNLFMWGMTLNEEERNDIKALAHSRFLENGRHVANWLTKNGITPSTWLTKDEEEFRKMAREYFEDQKNDL